MESLFERAERKAQESYRQTLSYAARSISNAFAGIVRKEELPEPHYKETCLKESYLEEMISYMEIIHKQDLEEVKQ